MMRKASCVASTSEHGFVLVAVLWIIAGLSALAMIFAVYLSNSAQALAINDAGLQAEALVSASLELTAYQLSLAGVMPTGLSPGGHLRRPIQPRTRCRSTAPRALLILHDRHRLRM